MPAYFEMAPCAVCAVPFAYVAGRVARIAAGDTSRPVCPGCDATVDELLVTRGHVYEDDPDTMAFEADEEEIDAGFDEEDFDEALAESTGALEGDD